MTRGFTPTHEVTLTLPPIDVHAEHTHATHMLVGAFNTEDEEARHQQILDWAMEHPMFEVAITTIPEDQVAELTKRSTGELSIRGDFRALGYEERR